MMLIFWGPSFIFLIAWVVTHMWPNLACEMARTRGKGSTSRGEVWNAKARNEHLSRPWFPSWKCRVSRWKYWKSFWRASAWVVISLCLGSFFRWQQALWLRSWRDASQRLACGKNGIVEKAAIFQIRRLASKMPIKKIHARQIYDSRGNPTVEVDLTTEKGIFRY